MMPFGLAAIDVPHGGRRDFDHIAEGCECLFGEGFYVEKIGQMSFTLGMPVLQK
ncbi:hypothetical protein D3C73_1665660 [compost metagenome]